MSVLTDSNSRALLFTVPYYIFNIVLYLYTLLKLLFHSFLRSFILLSIYKFETLSVSLLAGDGKWYLQCTQYPVYVLSAEQIQCLHNIIFHYKYRQKIYCSDSTFRICLMSHWSIHPFRFIAFGITYSIKRILN